MRVIILIVIVFGSLLSLFRPVQLHLAWNVETGKARTHKGFQCRVPVAVPLAPSVDRIMICKGSDKKIGYQESNFHNGKDDSHQ